MKINRSKKSGMVAVPIAAMGDIAFLLIIFFMIAATFAKEQAVELDAPTAAELEEIASKAVGVSLDKYGVLRVLNEEVRPDQLESYVRGLMEEREVSILRVKIDKNTTKGVYGPVFKGLAQAGVPIAVLGENEE